MEDNKPIRPKLTLSKSVNNLSIAEKLKVFTGNGSILLSGSDDNKQQPVTRYKTKNDEQTIKKSKLQEKDVQLSKGIISANNTNGIVQAKDKEQIVKANKLEIDVKKQKEGNAKVKEESEKKKQEQKLDQGKRLSFKGMLDKLRKLYPTTFPNDETKIVALKVGINKDIKENFELMKNLGISITYLGKFLKWYTSSRNYRTLTQIEGNARYDLTGQIVSVVTKEQALDVKKSLENKISKLELPKSVDI